MSDVVHGKRCGGKTRSGGRCGHPKGYGTDHVGSGRCKFHGGSSPTGRRAATREAALTFARGALGAEVNTSPLELMDDAGRLTRGLLIYYQHEIATAATRKPKDGGPNLARIEELRPQFEAAIKLAKDVAKAALDAGVAERRQRLAERQGALFAQAIADGLAEAFGELATAERRTVFAGVVERRLLVLEAEADDVVDGTLSAAA